MFVAVVSLGVAAPDAAQARRHRLGRTGGVLVGKMSEAARTRVAAFGRPLRLQFRDKRWRISSSIPRTARESTARVARALLAPPRTQVRLQVSSTQPRIRRYVDRLDRLFSYEPVDTQVVGGLGRPQFIEAKRRRGHRREGRDGEGDHPRAGQHQLAPADRADREHRRAEGHTGELRPGRDHPPRLEQARSSTARPSCAGSGSPPAALNTRHRSAPTASRRNR